MTSMSTEALTAARHVIEDQAPLLGMPVEPEQAATPVHPAKRRPAAFAAHRPA